MSDQLGFVILNYGQRDYTLQCLSALGKQTCKDFTVLVLDNSLAGKEMKEEDVKGIDPSFMFKRLAENRGFSAGNNPGIQYFLDHGFKFIWLLNNDTIPSVDAVEKTMIFMSQHPDIGIAGMKLVNSDERKTLQVYGGGMLNTQKVYTLPNKDPNKECDWICGGSMLVRREVFEKIGLFDEDFFLFFEDVDFSVRAKESGFKLSVIPQVEIIHFGGRSQPSEMALKHCRKSAFIYAKKHSAHPWISYLWIVETRILAPLVRSFFCKKQDPEK